MAARQAFSQVDASTVTANILSIVDQLKEIPKNSVTFPMDSLEDLNNSFAPSDLFFSDKDFLFSTPYIGENDAYLARFIEWDERVPYRGGNFKRTEAGGMLPDMVKGHAKPDDALIVKKAPFASLYQDKSAKIEPWHFVTIVDWEKFNLANHFLSAEDYFETVNICLSRIRRANFEIEKLIVDTFLATILGVGAYPHGSPLYPFFTDDDTHVPEDQFSKTARGYYLKAGEIRKAMDALSKEVAARCKNRVCYLTNINGSEFLGQVLDRTIPKAGERFADRSTKEKTLETLRKGYLTQDSNNKYTQVSPALRRQSLEAFMNMVFRTLRRFMTADKRNGCGYEAGKDSTNKEGLPLRSDPLDIGVFMNSDDLYDIGFLRGSASAGPITDVSPIRLTMADFTRMGVTFFPIDFGLPGMAIILNFHGFRLKDYFDEMYEHFAPVQLIKSLIHHTMKQVVLYSKWPCTVVEPALGQKYAVPVGGGSELLPHIIDAS